MKCQYILGIESVSCTKYLIQSFVTTLNICSDRSLSLYWWLWWTTWTAWTTGYLRGWSLLGSVWSRPEGVSEWWERVWDLDCIRKGLRLLWWSYRHSESVTQGTCISNFGRHRSWLVASVAYLWLSVNSWSGCTGKGGWHFWRSKVSLCLDVSSSHSYN